MSRRNASRRTEIQDRLQEIVRGAGPWRNHNLKLAEGVFTIGEGADGAEAGVRRVVQSLRDLFDGRFGGRRVLELGCGEGGFALEVARQGAEVVGLDGRSASVEKAEFAAEALGLARATFVVEPPRRLSPEAHGYFDAVLVLGLLEQLPVGEAIEVVRKVGAVTKGFALIETRVAARARSSHEHGGKLYREGGGGQGLGSVLTRASFFDLLLDAGFTTLAELQDPAAQAGTVSVIAWKGRRVAVQTAPRANAIVASRFSRGRPAKGLASLLSRRSR